MGRNRDDKRIVSAQTHYTIIIVIVAKHSNNFGSSIFH